MTNAPTHPKHSVIPSEVGWQFVPQYYTFVNKQPSRLHCFYTKLSTFVHGTEGEDDANPPAYGQQEIHQRILSLGYENCKVFIHSVDAQASAAGGILIQVIGEMSNRGEPWRKFVQTFFLAEQPSGYYVLNDIFRFLKEESVEEEQEEEGAGSEAPVAAEAVTVGEVSAVVEAVVAAEPEHQFMVDVPPQAEQQQHFAPPPQAPPVKLPTPAASRSPAPAASPAPAPAPEHLAAPPVSDAHPPAPLSTANGHAAPVSEKEEEKDEVVNEEVVVETAEAEVNLPAPAAVVVPAAPSPAPSQNKVDEKPATSSAPAPAASVSHPAVTPAPEKPVEKPEAPKPRSWATMAARDQQRWGANVAASTPGASSVPAAPSAPSSSAGPTAPGALASAPSTNAAVSGGSGTSTPPTHGAGRGRGAPQGKEHQMYVTAMQQASKSVFVKGVQDHVSDTALRTALTAFGPLDSLDIRRSKACAFVDYANVDAARKAIAASLPVFAGGNGGIDVAVGDRGGKARVSVEVLRERKERERERAERERAERTGGGGDRGGYNGGGGRGGGFGSMRGGRGGGRGGKV
ncbi:hypothetical protein SCHPADRAFT_915152 [Schizopora paradoxa]|uniref:NTF2-domain-containing protein n=1 Tax=Schizopora paradoxa TaxID=27342 RepID=A0A0H2RPY8_9AGAM|nr:hypothetical protein SCHPADRAFT_915152 [Schizopora paradoxa]